MPHGANRHDIVHVPLPFLYVWLAWKRNVTVWLWWVCGEHLAKWQAGSSWEKSSCQNVLRHNKCLLNFHDGGAYWASPIHVNIFDLRWISSEVHFKRCHLLVCWFSWFRLKRCVSLQVLIWSSLNSVDLLHTRKSTHILVAVAFIQWR